MDYLYSRNIIEKNKLIPRKISKKIINFINFDESNFEKQKDLKMSKYISYDKLCEIRKNFQKFKKGKIKNTLRNYYIYEYIQIILYILYILVNYYLKQIIILIMKVHNHFCRNYIMVKNFFSMLPIVSRIVYSNNNI